MLKLFSQTTYGDSIERIGACTTPGLADGVFIQGQYAYIADRAGFTSIDIAVPDNPTVIDFNGLEWATGIYLMDTLSFLNGALLGPKFSIIDISNPYSLTRLSWVEVPGYGGITPKGITVNDSICYYADSDGGFIIISIADILNPTVICTMETPGYVVDLFVKDTLAYVVDFDSLFIINVSDPVNPFIIGRRWIIEGGYDVWVSDDYAFLTEDDYDGTGSLYMIDVSDPTNPIEVRERTMNGIPYGIFVQGERVYIAADDYWYPPRSEKDGRADIEGGIRVFRWAEPDTLDLLVSFDTPGRCRDIFVQDSFLFVAVGDSFMIYKYISTGIEEEKESHFQNPSSFQILASPNPFYKNIRISFTLSYPMLLSLSIFNSQGRMVKNLLFDRLNPGEHSLVWNGSGTYGKEMPSGVYFIKAQFRIRENIQNQVMKVIYMKGVN